MDGVGLCPNSGAKSVDIYARLAHADGTHRILREQLHFIDQGRTFNEAPAVSNGERNSAKTSPAHAMLSDAFKASISDGDWNEADIEYLSRISGWETLEVKHWCLCNQFPFWRR